MTKNTQTFVPIYSFHGLNWKHYLRIALKEFADLNMMDKNEVFNFYVPFVIKVYEYSTNYNTPNKYRRISYLTFLPKHIAFFSNTLLKNYIDYVKQEIHKKLKQWEETLCGIEPITDIIKSGLDFEDTLYSHRYYTDQLKDNFYFMIQDLDYVHLQHL